MNPDSCKCLRLLTAMTIYIKRLRALFKRYTEFKRYAECAQLFLLHAKLRFHSRQK